MATRFYLANSTAVLPTLALSSEWDGSTANKSSMSTGRTGGALTDTQSAGESSATSPYDFPAYQYVSSETIPTARTIGGTLSAVVRGYQNTGAQSFLQLVVRVVSNDGTVVRGILYAGATQTTVTTTAGAQNQETPTYAGATGTPTRIWNAIPLSSVNAQAGDRIVVEVGARFTNTSTSLATFRYYRGDPTDTTTYPDLPLAAGATTQGVPWVEFSDDLFGAGGTAISGTLAGSLKPLTGSLSGGAVAPVDGSLAGSLRPLSASLSGSVPLEGTLTGSLPRLVGSFAATSEVLVDTDTTYASDGYSYDGVAEVDYEPPVAPTPARVRRATVMRVHQSLPAPTLVDGRPT